MFNKGVKCTEKIVLGAKMKPYVMHTFVRDLFDIHALCFGILGKL